MQPLVHSEGEDHSDHVAELPTPGVGFLAHSPARQILTESILDTRLSCHVSAHLVETTGSALQCGPRTVVASPALCSALEAVADVLHVISIMIHPDEFVSCHRSSLPLTDVTWRILSSSAAGTACCRPTLSSGRGHSCTRHGPCPHSGLPAGPSC